MIAYIPFIILGFVVLVALLPVIIYFHNEDKKAEERLQTHLRQMHIESNKNTRIAEQIITDLRVIHRDNAIFLRRIFERVDKPSVDSDE